MIRLIVDRDEVDALYQQIAPELRLAISDSGDPSRHPSRIVLRRSLIRLIVELGQSGRLPIPSSAIDSSLEEARFDAIWRTQILERTWQRLEALEIQTGQPLHLVLHQRAEAPGLSFAELADRIAQALNRPISVEATRKLLRRASSEFSRMLLEEVIATLPSGSPFETIERELIETNLLAFCREAIGGLRNASQSGRSPRVRRRSS